MICLKRLKKCKFSAFLGLVILSQISNAFALEKIPIDLLIKGDYLLTMVEGDKIIRSGAVAVDDGKILAIGKNDILSQLYIAEDTLEGGNRVVMPGLINGHSHAAMTLFRGVADDYPLFEWLSILFPAEVNHVDSNFVRVGTELACWEMIRGGTTTFVDMYYFPDTIAEVVKNCGLRALISATIIDQRSPDAVDAADSLKNARAFVEKWQGISDRIIPILGPHSNYTLNLAQLKQTRSLADELGVGLSIHMAESPYEKQYALEKYKSSSVLLYNSIGFLDGDTIAAHMVVPSQEEIRLLREKKIGVIYNPTSNMKTAAGVAPIVEMLEAGVKIGLGTDGAASNNDLDMWEEMRLATLLQKVKHMNPEVLPASKILAMATREGAKAIGLSKEIGTLEAGRWADIIQVSTGDVHFFPMYDLISHLVYVSDEQDVTSVVVAGKILMRDRRLLTLDTSRVRKEAETISNEIRLGLKSR